MRALKKNFLIFLVSWFLSYSFLGISKSDEKLEGVISQIQIISQDLKTLEKVIYSKSSIVENSNSSTNNLNEDVLTKFPSEALYDH